MDCGLIEKIKKSLTPDLLKDEFWRERNRLEPMAGHCYVASEAYYHLCGQRCKPYVISGIEVGRFKTRISHWFLRCKGGEIIDITASQFPSLPPYDKAKGCGFLTKQPSKRAQVVIERVKAL